MATASCISPKTSRDVADDRLVQRLHVHAQTGVGVRVAPRQLLHHRAQLLLRNLAARGGRKAANDIDDVRIANGREVTAERERARNSAIAAQPDIDVGGERRLELGAHDADDGVAAAIEEQRSAQSHRVPHRTGGPQPVAENRDTARIRPRRLRAAACGRSTPSTPSVVKNVPDAPTARSRSGSARPASVGENSSNAASESNDRDSRRQSTKLAGATHRSGLSDAVSHTMTSRSGLR